jgi:hypothetical protein
MISLLRNLLSNTTSWIFFGEVTVHVSIAADI